MMWLQCEQLAINQNGHGTTMQFGREYFALDNMNWKGSLRPRQHGLERITSPCAISILDGHVSFQGCCNLGDPSSNDCYKLYKPALQQLARRPVLEYQSTY